MNRINVLLPHVADLIAAGEVVERPGSVIKELMENAIDAGATALTVEIKNGGMTYMRVTDNGCGMSPEDAETAFLRHATSKLRDERGLEAIGTLGFRGEALAAIAAVSRVELLTCEAGAGEGTRIVVEGGQVLDKSPVGCPDGTTMIVRDVFFNTPARLKFMKNDRAEGMNVSSAVLRCALSHPEISVRYIKDGKEEYHTPGDGIPESCIYSLLGREFASSLIEVHAEVEGVRVSGFISTPARVKGNRANQFFFVNGRFIRSKTLQAALEQAYKNSLLTGRFPACVLYITMSCASLDVNVHPTKTEVKFLNEKRVFDSVYYAGLSALGGEVKREKLKLPDDTGALMAHTPVPDSPVYASRKTGSAAPDTAPYKGDTFYKTMTADTFKSRYSGGGFKTSIAARPQKTGFSPVHDRTKINYQTRLDLPEENAQVPEMREAHEPYKIIGEALSTYIIAEKGDTLILIDKHAAHERVIFDRLKAEEGDVMPQIFAVPVVCDMDPEEAVLLLENAELLRSLGFEIEEFGGSSVILREAPAEVDTGDVRAMLDAVCEKLALTGRVDASDVKDGILASVACKAAIKAGRSSELAEMRAVVEAVIEDDVKFCPHGRPVALELTREILNKNFKRI
ncbi:MAG: DNA mismatch repair endonuclease MutL [Oscillospiraceae bacterium]